MADLRPHAYSLVVRNLGEQVLVLLSFLSGRQKPPPAKTHATVASSNRKFICVIKFWASMSCVKGGLGDQLG